jgi:hypothetical protein
MATKRKAVDAPVEVAPPAPPATNGAVITDPATIAAVDEYARIGAEATRIEARRKALKALILREIGDAPVAYAGSRVINVSLVPELPPTPDRIITAEMVGQTLPGLPGRAGYRQLTVR